MSGAWNSHKGGKTSSPGVSGHCSNENELRSCLIVYFVFLKNFIATILVQCSLTQATKIQGQKCPWNRRDSGASVCWITSTDLATPAPFHNKLVWGDGKASLFSEFADQVFYSAAPSDFEVWTPVPHPQVWESVESLLTGTAVLNMRRWVSHYQSLKPRLCLFLCFEAFSCTSKALTPQSLMKEIKRNFTRLHQKQIYKLKDYRIRSSGWEGKTLKC